MRAVGAGLVLSALFLASCSTAAEPTTLATPTAEAPTTATAVEATPSPTAVDGKDLGDAEADALAFLARYMDTAEASIRSAEALEERRLMYTESCQPCADGTEVAQSILNSGLAVDGGQIEWSVNDVNISGDSALVQVTRTISAVTLSDSQGQMVESSAPSEPATELYQLVRSDGSWLIAGISRLP